jgi:cytoskeletal protein RodZ
MTPHLPPSPSMAQHHSSKKEKREEEERSREEERMKQEREMKEGEYFPYVNLFSYVSQTCVWQPISHVYVHRKVFFTAFQCGLVEISMNHVCA